MSDDNKIVACKNCGERFDYIPEMCPNCSEIIADHMDPAEKQRIQDLLNPPDSTRKILMIVYGITFGIQFFGAGFYFLALLTAVFPVFILFLLPLAIAFLIAAHEKIVKRSVHLHVVMIGNYIILMFVLFNSFEIVLSTGVLVSVAAIVGLFNAYKLKKTFAAWVFAYSVLLMFYVSFYLLSYFLKDWKMF